MTSLTAFNFNAADVKDDATYELLPAGLYTAMATKVDIAPIKSDPNGGRQARFEFTIQGPTHAGRKVWANFPLWHSDATKAQTAVSMLKPFSTAVGVTSFTDLEQLVNIPLSVLVEVSPGSNGYGPSNRIKKYQSQFQGAQGATPGMTGAVANSSISANGAMPWVR